MSYVPQPSSVTLISPPTVRGDGSKPPGRLDNGQGAFPCPGQTNVFEWCWEHSQATEEDRELLLCVAWDCTGDTDTWPGLWHHGDLEDLYKPIGRLQQLGELQLLPSAVIAEDYNAGRLDLSDPAPHVDVRFPAYQASQGTGRWTR